MRLTALVKNAEDVCCRYRLASFRALFENAGHRLDLCAHPKRWLSPWFLRPPGDRSDVVVLQRRLLPAWQLALLRRAARYLIFDFDDAVFARDSFAPRGLYSATRMRRFAATVKAADAVVAGNAFLADQAARWTDGRRVHVVPTCIDPARYSLAQHTRRGAVQLAWIGSASTLRGLEQGRPVLENTADRCPDLTLKIICDRFLTLRHLRVLPCPWSSACEARDLADADIGISWLPDDVWSRGKCGLKVLQYMAAGLPVVANPVGVQAALIRHGETGFLAETADEWAWAIDRLAHDPELRSRMGRAGRQRVEEEFDLSAGAARWLTMLDQLGQTAANAATNESGTALRWREAYAPG